MGGFKWIPSRLIYFYCRAAKAEITLLEKYISLFASAEDRDITSALLIIVYFHHAFCFSTP